MGEQARRLFEAQAGRDEQVCEQRVAQPVPIARAGSFRTVRGQAPQADLAEDAVIVHRDEPHVRPLGGTLIGVVARGDHAAAATLRRSPYRSEETTSELQSLMRISYADFCLKKKNKP